MKFLKRIWNFQRNVRKPHVPKIYEEIPSSEWNKDRRDKKPESFSKEEIDIIKRYRTKSTYIEEYGSRGNAWCIKIITNKKKHGEFNWYYESAETFIIELHRHSDEWYYVAMERPDINDLPASERRKVMISTGKSTSRFVDSWSKEKKYYRCDQFDSLQQLLSDMI